MSAGGTILNWAGRLPAIERIEEISSRETIEVGQWDHTLSELRDDPDVEEAIEAIDSDPPPAAFIRSTPPSDRAIDEAAHRGEEQEPAVGADYHEPAEVDPPPLTYEQVFEQGSAEASLRAPRAVEPSSVVPRRDPTPSMLPWALLLLALVFGASAIAFVISQRRAPRAEPAPVPASVPTPAPVSAPVPASAPTPAPVSASAAEPVPASAPTPESAPTPAPAAEPTPTPAPKGDPDRVYPETGAADTYDAQLALARRLKRGSRAVAAYRRAITLDPQGADALAELARLMLARQHTREATELAERASAIDPSNALAWVTLGAARQMRGDRQGARQAYQNCAKLGKGKYVAECRAMLR